MLAALGMTLLIALTLLAAPQSRDSFLEEALFAGGARDQAQLDRLVALYHQRVDPIVEVVRGQPQAIAAQLLLKHFHVSYGGTTALLKEYRRGAWSLNETLETGIYNCLSASMLFVLAARQAGLDVTGELYDDHARPVVTIDGHAYQIEATSQYGFNATDWDLRLRADRHGRLYVAVVTPVSRGTEPLLEATWAWAGEARDARWAAHVAPTPPPLVPYLPQAAPLTSSRR